jgi:hypothetical protein
MGCFKEFQALKFQPSIPDRPGIFYQTVQNCPPDPFSSKARRNIHALNLPHVLFKFLQTTHPANVASILNKVETSVGRMKLVGIRQIRLHHSLDIELDAILAPESIVQASQILTNKGACLLLVLIALDLVKFHLCHIYTSASRTGLSINYYTATLDLQESYSFNYFLSIKKLRNLGIFSDGD